MAVLRKSSALLTMMVQHQTEASSRPIITIWTTIEACSAIDQIETSGTASAAGAASVAVCAKAEVNIGNPCAAPGRRVSGGRVSAVPQQFADLRLPPGAGLATGIKDLLGLRRG